MLVGVVAIIGLSFTAGVIIFVVVLRLTVRAVIVRELCFVIRVFSISGVYCIGRIYRVSKVFRVGRICFVSEISVVSVVGAIRAV